MSDRPTPEQAAVRLLNLTRSDPSAREQLIALLETKGYDGPEQWIAADPDGFVDSVLVLEDFAAQFTDMDAEFDERGEDTTIRRRMLEGGEILG